MISDKKNCIVVCGPTASGKTRLAVAIAREIKGEILSADSRQIYRGMDIGTGKDIFEYRGDSFSVPYHLIDIREPSEIYSLFDYKVDFEAAYYDVVNREKMPVITGGSGLYIEAVLRNYDIAAIPEDIALRGSLMTKEKSELASQLETCAPDLYKKTDLNSKKRIIRSLEIAKYRKTSEPASKNTFPVLYPLILCTSYERSKLLDRIDKRLDERLAQGLVCEVQQLIDKGISHVRLSLFGMEYKHVAMYLDSSVTYPRMVDNLRIAIHQLSKRQESWFRGMERRGFTVHRVNEASIDIAMDILKKNGYEEALLHHTST